MKDMQEDRAKQSAAGAGGVLERLFELAMRLDDDMDRGLQDQGLTRARAELLWRLGQHGPMTHQALSLALRCTPRNVTGLVDSLQADGFVSRGPHPSDRRASLVGLTEQGQASLAAMHAGSRQLAARLFGDLPKEELAVFAAVLDVVLQRLRATAQDPAA